MIDRRMARFALSAGGYAFTLSVLAVGFRTGQFGSPYDYAGTFDPVGDRIRSGLNPYDLGFVYSPPFALACALISWLPVPVASLLVVIAEILALRYIAGSWTAVGFVAWCPFLVLELVLGNVNLIVGACILAAVRGHGWAGVVGFFLKLSPILAVREWRTAAVAFAVIGIVMLPWFGLWFDWAQALMGTVPSGGVGPMVPVPLHIRLVIAAGLLAARRPWTTALACVVAIPVFHPTTLLLLIVPIAAFLDRSRVRDDTLPGSHAGSTVQREASTG